MVQMHLQYHSRELESVCVYSRWAVQLPATVTRHSVPFIFLTYHHVNLTTLCHVQIRIYCPPHSLLSIQALER